MIFDDISDNIYRTFVCDVYVECSWTEFVMYKDLGLVYIERYFNDLHCCYSSVYEVVDQKKWALARLKYGI